MAGNDESKADDGDGRGRAFEVLWTPAPPAEGESRAVPPPGTPAGSPAERSAAGVARRGETAHADLPSAPPARPGGRLALRLALGLALLAVVLAGAALVRSMREDAVAAGDPAASVATGAEAARAVELEAELARERTRGAEVQRRLDELELRGKEQEELALARERIVRDEAEALRAELAAARQELASRDAAVQAAEARAVELEKQVSEQAKGLSETARAALGFDSALALAGERRLGEAREAIAGLAALGQGGTPVLSALVDALEEADRFEAGVAAGKLAPIALLALRSSLARVEATRAELAPAALAWFEERGGAQERLGRLDALLVPLRERVEKGSAALAAVDGEEWKQLSAAFKPSDSSAVLAHSERFGCGHALELAPRVASELPSALLRYRSLDVAALREVTGLAGWMKLVRGGALALPDRQRIDLELLEFAQRWYDEDPGNDAPANWAALALPSPADERLDWRKQLELVSRLAGADSGWPIRENGLRILCCVKADGTVEWQRELALNVREGVWRIQRDRLSGDGRKVLDSSALRVERRGHEYVVAGADELLLDLHARGTAVTVAPYPRHVEVVVPLALGLSPDDLAAFRAHSGTCLVQQHGNTRRWFDPSHGLVREELRTPSGGEVRDLVFAR